MRPDEWQEVAAQNRRDAAARRAGMFDALTTMETAALLEKIIGAAEASGAYYPGDDFARPGTLGCELHELRVEVREMFLRKFFEVPQACAS